MLTKNCHTELSINQSIKQSINPAMKSEGQIYIALSKYTYFVSLYFKFDREAPTRFLAKVAEYHFAALKKTPNPSFVAKDFILQKTTFSDHLTSRQAPMQSIS